MSGIGFSGEKVLADFRPVYWSAKWFPAENATAAKLGTWFDVSHPVFAGFPTEDFTDWQWFGIVGGVVTHRLCGLPADYRPFALSVNDFHFAFLAAGLDLSRPLFDETPKWSGTHFTKTISGLAPRRCVLRFDFSQPGDTITSAKGLVDGHDFRMPLTRKRGDKSFAEVDADFSCFRRGGWVIIARFQ